MKIYFYMLFLILGLLQTDRVYSQDPQWPLHTICNSNKLTVTYRSCGQSVAEFYSSFKLFLNGLHVWGVDEPLCLPQFPRFTFCGSRRGEMITMERLIKSKVDLPLKGHFNLMVHGINQDGFQIICVNATLSFW
ncbi:lymphocyte antigen 86 isoform X2 [Danio aesculapii]|uniref:lymphocyte antigen 86 isoform X2 n=1 Tax=Danio aesculapii TaxID=1142201 RepID=UPI0024BFFE4A|nr:lymphocyte antigen 86 isoform X2 [Danio aesculapii]